MHVKVGNRLHGIIGHLGFGPLLIMAQLGAMEMVLNPPQGTHLQQIILLGDQNAWEMRETFQ